MTFILNLRTIVAFKTVVQEAVFIVFIMQIKVLWRKRIVSFLFIFAITVATLIFVWIIMIVANVVIIIN